MDPSDLQRNEEMEFAKQLLELEMIVKARMSREAVERYGNIKAAHPKKAAECLIFIGQLIQKQNVAQITDDDFKGLLRKMEAPQRQFKINRV